MAKADSVRNDERKSPRKKQRLGRGLSSLMGQPVSVEIPKQDVNHPVSPINESSQTKSNRDEPSGNERQSSDPPTEIKHKAVPDRDPPAEKSTVEPQDGDDPTRISLISVSRLRVNPHQPRQIFDDVSLRQLAESIRTEGVIQPIVARPIIPTQSDDSSETGSTTIAYELVAGERRWRAAQLIGLTHIPAIVKELDDRQTAEWSLIENLQREDLNPIERAEAFEHLINQFGLSHEQIAQRVGVNRSTVTNTLRLLHLSDKVRQWVLDGRLSAGHAKALASLPDPQTQDSLAKQALVRGWSVRQIEQWANKIKDDPSQASFQPGPTKKGNSGYLSELEQKIGQQLGTKTKIRKGRKKGSGTLLIDFYSLEDFDGLMNRLGVSAELD